MGGKAKKSIITLVFTVILPLSVLWLTFSIAGYRGKTEEVKIKFKSEHTPSVDHREFKILQQDFDDPRKVTEACLSCHNGRDEEIMATAHWNWERETTLPGREGTYKIGKKNLINNFCTGVIGNNGSCMRCHIGYGWEDDSFDFGDSKNIDCLVCHDNTETYFKQKGRFGWPATEETANAQYQVPDYPYVAQNIGLPKKNNCGICHFYGGGGNNVKHGDLEQAIVGCSRKVDVHMTAEGADMSCIDCHLTEKHNIKGKLYSVSADNANRISCEQCHTSSPHNDQLLDQHNAKVACQTCHIPKYAKANATKLWWDYSTAGRLDDEGYAISENDADGNHNYLSIKGSFVWDKNVQPEYTFFNGTADHYLFEDTIKEIPVKIIDLKGNYTDSASKIIPVKVHRGRQPYDVNNKTLISLKLWAAQKGEGAFWKDFDFQKASEIGMELAGRPYSGEYDFVKTEAAWPINHMVSPKENTVSCKECHARDGRLENLSGFYMPGRDYSKLADMAGYLLIIFSLLGVFGHATIRIITSFRKH
jgi:octaheme c-type cytochrome (tetrathionate reductase family)